MLVYRKLDDFELMYNREFLKHYVKIFHSVNCKNALYILELIILICVFHVKCLSICIVIESLSLSLSVCLSLCL